MALYMVMGDVYGAHVPLALLEATDADAALEAFWAWGAEVRDFAGMLEDAGLPEEDPPLEAVEVDLSEGVAWIGATA